jgi:WD40 repeat protein
LQNQEAQRYLAQSLLEKSEQEAKDQRWSRAAAYAAAARTHDDTAEARWRAAQRGPVQIDPVWRTQLPTGIDAIAISRGGTLIAAALGDHSIRVLDARGEQKQSLEGHEGKVSALAFTPDGQTLVSAGEDHTLFAWNVESGDRTRLESDARVRNIAFSPDGAAMATATGEGHLRLWTVDGWQPGMRLDGHDGGVSSVDFSSDGAALISSGEDGTLRFWSPVNSGKLRPQMRMVRGEGHQPANRVAFVSDTTIVSASNDGTVRFFALDGKQLARLNFSHGAILDLAAPQRGVVAALGQDSAVMLID